jgi:phosphoglycerol transferase MdoB-like AlkP superfamily enzyme
VQLANLVKTNKKFNLNILTLGPHHPNGFYDSKCESLVNKQELDIETMVSCDSYLVGDFINYVKKLGIFDNTMIYIMNDHKGMGGAINIKNWKNIKEEEISC